MGLSVRTKTTNKEYEAAAFSYHYSPSNKSKQRNAATGRPQLKALSVPMNNRRKLIVRFLLTMAVVSSLMGVVWYTSENPHKQWLRAGFQIR